MAATKKCRLCSKRKSIDDFAARENNKTRSECRKCISERNKKLRQDNLEEFRAHDRKRSLTKEFRERSRKYYLKNIASEEWRLKESARQKVKNANYPLKRAANIIVGNALAGGRLIRQPCERCGDAKAQAHHEDYTKPLDVIWLCKAHHGERHREINEEKRHDRSIYSFNT